MKIKIHIIKILIEKFQKMNRQILDKVVTEIPLISRAYFDFNKDNILKEPILTKGHLNFQVKYLSVDEIILIIIITFSLIIK